MNDGHVYCRGYYELKNYIVDIINGDVENYDIDSLSEHIQQLYDSGEMQATQYDDLMRYFQDDLKKEALTQDEISKLMGRLDE